MQRYVTRGLGEGPVSVSLVVTVGLFVGLIGLAQQIWPPAPRTIPFFMPDSGLEIGGTYVPAHQLITIALSAVVAVGLYALLNRTRMGTAMRASVDNPDLLRLFGGKPSQVAALSWAIGIALGALAGILLTPVIGLDYFNLTLLVINAYAAAMLGRLKSLPLTFAGAMGLGILQSYAVAYLPTDGNLAGIRAVVPALFLFAVIVLMPQAQLRVGQVKGIVSAPLPSIRASLGWGGGLLFLVLLMSISFSNANLLLVGTAATYAMVMLSLVLLTGYGGHVSLAQFTFAGVGALTYAKLDQPNLYGLCIAALVAAVAGALVALPVLRLTGLYLALSTLAFGLLMDQMVFQSSFGFGFNGTLQAERLSAAGDLGRLDRCLRAGDVRVLRADGLRAAPAARWRARPRADRHARQPGGLRHARTGHALVPGRAVRAHRRHGRARRRALRGPPRHHRRDRLPAARQPPAPPARGRLRRHLGDRCRARRRRADAAPGAPELPARAGRPDVRGASGSARSRSAATPTGCPTCCSGWAGGAGPSSRPGSPDQLPLRREDSAYDEPGEVPAHAAS